jgi:hypothetical protein
MAHAERIKFCDDCSACGIITNVANYGAARIGSSQPCGNISGGATTAGADSAGGVAAEVNLLRRNVYARDDIEHYIADT